MSSENKRTMWKQITLIVLAVIILGAPTLVYPFGRDQAEYAWIAASALHGKLSYSDIFNVKPPLSHLIHEAALLLFGYNMASIRILDLLWQGVTAILIFKIAKQLEQHPAARIIAAVLYLTLYYTMNFWTTAQTDGFITLPIAAGILLFLQAQQKNQLWRYAASGLAIGLATLLKYPIGILALLLMILELLRLKKNGFIPALLMGVGLLLPLSVSALDMFRRSNLDDFLWIQTTYISKYSIMSQPGLSYIGSIGLGFLIMLSSPIIGWTSICGWYGLFVGSSRSRPVQVAIIAAWWISAAVHFIVQNKFYGYHALPMYAPLALMLSQFFIDGLKTSNRVRFALSVIGVLLMAVPFTMFDFPWKYIRLWNVATREVPLQTVYGHERFGGYNNGSDFSSRADMEVAEYIASHSKQDEKIFVWGFEPSIYFLSQRENATRFIYNFPLYGPNANPELRLEFLNELQEQKPVYIVIVKNDAISHVTATSDDSWTAYNSFNELHNFVLTHYHFETTIEDFVIYRFDK